MSRKPRKRYHPRKHKPDGQITPLDIARLRHSRQPLSDHDISNISAPLADFIAALKNGSCTPIHYWHAIENNYLFVRLIQLLQSLPTVPPGFAGPAWGADLHLSPDGRWLYTSERNSHTLAGFAIDAATGVLTPMGHWHTQLQPRGFAITPDGRYLVAAGQLSHRVGVHMIAPGNGALTQVGEHDVGLNPNWITVLSMPPNA